VPTCRAYVLGPPRDEKLLKKDLPSKVRGSEGDGHEGEFKEVYLSGDAANQAIQLAPALGDLPSDGHAPLPNDLRFPFADIFRGGFKVNGKQLEWDDEEVPRATQEFFERHYFGRRAAGSAEAAWRRIDGDWLGTVEQLALNLDSDTNNTSLVLALEWGDPGSGRVLLFPGDAQVGNWLSWRDQKYRAGDKSLSADDLLSRTVLYKVGHHGSHNATVKCDPRETTDAHEKGVPFGLELMENIIALVPVDRDAADKKMPKPWKMPHLPLYRRLREKAQRRVLRADLSLAPLDSGDEADLTPASTEFKPVPGLKGCKWRRSAEEFRDGTPGPLYYDVAFDKVRG